MGKLDVFDIVFQNDGVCYVGQLLQGFVQISLSKPMKMKGEVMTKGSYLYYGMLGKLNVFN